ncbi:MAG: phosphoribosyltransferase family protein [Desulfurococcaceae archaeon]
MVRNTVIRSIAIRTPSEGEIREIAEHIVKAYGFNKFMKLKIRVLANEVLKLLKPYLPYKILSDLTNIPESVLCRYVRGNIIPSFEQAVNILAKISLSIDIDYLLKELVEEEKSNIIDLSRVLKDPYIIRLLSIIICLKTIGKDVSKIVATAEAVTPLATLLSIELNAPVVLIKKKAYPGIHYYTVIVPRSPKDTEILYIDKDLISRKDSLLIISDVVYTGRTLKTILDILEKTKARIVDIFVILGLGDEWRNRLKNYDIKVLTHLPPPF